MFTRESLDGGVMLADVGTEMKHLLTQTSGEWFEVHVDRNPALGSFVVKAANEDHAQARLRHKFATEDPAQIPNLQDMTNADTPADLIPHIQALLDPREDYPKVTALNLGIAAFYASLPEDKTIVYRPSNLSS